jgi:ATP-binding cassette subfamily B protein
MVGLGIKSLQYYIYFYKYIRRKVPLLLLSSTISLIVSTGMGMAFPLISKYTIDVLIPKHDTVGYMYLVYGIIITTVVLVPLTILQGYFQNRVTLGPLSRLKLRILGKSLSIDHANAQPLNIGFLLQVNESDSNATIGSLLSIIPTAAISAIQFVIYALLSCTVSLKLTAIAMLIVPLNVIVYYLNAKYMREQQKQIQELNISFKGFLTSTFRALGLVKSYSLEQKVLSVAKSSIKGIVGKSWDIWRIGNAISVVSTLVGQGSFLFYSYALYLVIKGQLSLGSYSAFVMYLGLMMGPLKALAGLYNQIIMNSIPMDRIAQVMAQRTGADDGRSETAATRDLDGDIQVKGLTFSYARGCSVLNGLSFSIAQGEHLAVTGPTGSGKSTLAKILSRYEGGAYQGEICIAGHELRALPPNTVRRTVLYSEQEPNFLPAHILDNIALWHDYPIARIHEVCDALGIHRTIENLPESYRTVVNSDYAKSLSGGQLQLIAIARALLRNPQVLILDEATSALDMATELRAIETIRKLRAGRTTFFISHRIPALRKFERVMVLCAGSLEAVGTHDEVYRASPTYGILCDVAGMQQGSGRLALHVERSE